MFLLRMPNKVNCFEVTIFLYDARYYTCVIMVKYQLYLILILFKLKFYGNSYCQLPSQRNKLG